MSEAKDPAIKLFGKTIPLPDTAAAAAAAEEEDYDSGGAGEDLDFDEALSCERQSDNKKQNGGNPNSTSNEATDPNKVALANHNPNNTTADNDSPPSKQLKAEEEQSETNNSSDKTLKKPDKILPCPRCNSMDTKFCYFNNYNVNQPRHFCKKCQRYWTAGGTMRNVPVGAGRRKNKAASQYCHVSVSQALHNAPNGPHYPTISPNGTVLAFGSDMPLCESMASVLLTDKTIHKPENLKILVPSDAQSLSSASAAKFREENGNNGPNGHYPYPPQVPILAGPPWTYPLNMAQWVPPPGVIPSGYPMPFYPAPAYWGCTVPPPWTAPFVSPPPNTIPYSPTLGKHCRDEDTSKNSSLPEEGDEKSENSTERSLWIPKTLRIDDPGEAAKSSIWATLGIKPEKCGSSSGGGAKGGLFKAFQSKADERCDSSNTSPVLKANPAALSRSRNFQESS